MTDLVLPGLPFPLQPSGNPSCQAVVSDGALTLTGGAKSDLFIDPAGEEGGRPDAGRLTGLPGDRDFRLAARVSVQFVNVFDAGVLLLYLSERRWAKLCYELSPQRHPTVVSVVTRGTSDDSNSFETAAGTAPGTAAKTAAKTAAESAGKPVWLRITRAGRAWAFHASEDGAWWRMVRYFTLGEGSGARVGFLAQSPQGPGCTAVFDSITYTSGAVDNLRDGS
jgi:regulation of enolase protein 1 (concanavalin A-like superfamily)